MLNLANSFTISSGAIALGLRERVAMTFAATGESSLTIPVMSLSDESAQDDYYLLKLGIFFNSLPQFTGGIPVMSTIQYN